MNVFFLALSASIFVSLLSFIGGLLLLISPLFQQKYLMHLVSFAAGVMLGAVFLDLIPEAMELSQELSICLWVLAGIVTTFALERFLIWHHHHHDKPHTATLPAASLILVGDSIHNFIDGIALSAAFLTGPMVGIVTTIAISFHEIPQELADFSVLIHSGMKKRKALLYNFYSALPAVLGTFVGFYFFVQNELLLAPAIAFTSGMFIYIALADLVPELHKDKQNKKEWIQILPFIGGICIMYTLTILIQH